MAFQWVLDEKKFLALEQVRKLRKFCGQEKKKAVKRGEFLPVRDWFMIELGLNTGLRVQEMADLKHGDLFVSVLQASVIVKKGKGSRKRRVMVNESFKKDGGFFQRWKNLRGQAIDDYSPVFTSERGGPVTKRALQKSFKRIMRDAGLESHYSIHCLRHTYATHLLKASGNNFKLVTNQLGHSSIKVSEVYLGLIEEEVKKALSRLYE